MNDYAVSLRQSIGATITESMGRCQRVRSLLVVLSLLVLLLTACSGLGGDPTSSATPTPVPVNGFGIAANHVHSLIALPGNVLLLATHYGLFRSSDNGQSWKVVAAGPNQIMDGLMTFSLVASPLNAQRLYVLTQTRYSTHAGVIGMYTSADQGRSWKLTIPESEMGGAIDFVQSGNDSPDEVYAYVHNLGSRGLKVSTDNGEHFSVPGTLPFGRILGLLALPGAPGQLLAYSNDGIARSTDSGAHWSVLPAISSAVFGMTTPGANQPIYAAGDAGIYVSQDGGKSFSLVYSQTSYGSLIASPVQPTLLYGDTSRGVFQSKDGGHTWSSLPAIQGSLGNLAPDPVNASVLYLSLSYPTKMYRFDQQTAQWLSLTPKA